MVRPPYPYPLFTFGSPSFSCKSTSTNELIDYLVTSTLSSPSFSCIISSLRHLLSCPRFSWLQNFHLEDHLWLSPLFSFDLFLNSSISCSWCWIFTGEKQGLMIALCENTHVDLIYDLSCCKKETQRLIQWLGEIIFSLVHQE